MKAKTKKILIFSAVVVAVIVVAFLLFHKKKAITFSTFTIENSSVQQNVTATGYVEPVDEVEVGTQVSGKVQKIYVDYNSRVTKGELLAELDKSTLNERLSEAQASLNSSESALKYAQQNYNRTKALYDANAASEADFQEVKNALVQAQSNYSNAQTSVREAKVNLSYAEIYSPIDGVVLAREVEEGQTVAASYSTPTMFIIANDIKKMQVEANVDEADIGAVKLGQTVTFTVDAYPTMNFDGTVNQIRLEPTTTNNVVTYTVIINAPNPDEKLFPGMTASVTIITKNENGPIVPLQAFDYQPTSEVFKLLGKPEMPDSLKKGKWQQGKKPRHDWHKMHPQGAPTEFGNEGKNSTTQASRDSMKTVWIKNGNMLHPQMVKVGMNDGVNAIVYKGLRVGDTVVLSSTIGVKVKIKKASSNPFMPTPPGRRNKNK